MSELYLETETKTPAPTNDALDAFKDYAEAQRTIQGDRLNAIRDGFGKVGTKFMASMESNELSVVDKGGAALATVVDGVGEAVKGIGSVSAAANVIGAFGEKPAKVYDAGMSGFVDTFSGKVVNENENGTYGFDAAGIAELANGKALLKTGVEGIVSGVDAGAAQSDVFVQEALESNPNDAAAKALDAAYDAYDSGIGRKIVAASSASVAKKLTR